MRTPSELWYVQEFRCSNRGDRWRIICGPLRSREAACRRFFDVADRPGGRRLRIIRLETRWVVDLESSDVGPEDGS